MSLTPDEQLTLACYERAGIAWAKLHADPDFWQPEFLQFTSLLPGGRVLEVGCGGGRDALTLTQHYDYIGSDRAFSLLPYTRTVEPRAGKLLQQDLYRMAFANQTFDGAWVSAVLLHIPKDRVATALAEIRRVVRPGGVVFVSLKEGEGQTVKTEVEQGVELERLFVYYRLGEFERFTWNAGFKVLRILSRSIRNTTWISYFLA
jgi:ubiquinone/menaquinone biosynthesis C-methylase UbiE